MGSHSCLTGLRKGLNQMIPGNFFSGLVAVVLILKSSVACSQRTSLQFGRTFETRYSPALEADDVPEPRAISRTILRCRQSFLKLFT